VNTVAAFLEATRSQSAIELESVNHYLTLWFCAHKECADEVREYKTAQRYLEAVAGSDDDVATHLLLTLAKDTYRMCYGHRWEDRR
jgi:hypothetical protein